MVQRECEFVSFHTHKSLLIHHSGFVGSPASWISSANACLIRNVGMLSVNCLQA